MLHIKNKILRNILFGSLGPLVFMMTYDHKKKIIILVEDHPMTIPIKISLN